MLIKLFGTIHQIISDKFDHILNNRKKYEGRYPQQPPTASFKGNYGQLKMNSLEEEKVEAARSLAEKELLDEGAPIKYGINMFGFQLKNFILGPKPLMKNQMREQFLYSKRKVWQFQNYLEWAVTRGSLSRKR